MRSRANGQFQAGNTESAQAKVMAIVMPRGHGKAPRAARP